MVVTSVKKTSPTSKHTPTSFAMQNWNLVDQYNCVTSKLVNTIIGFDAHSTDQMIKRMDYVKLIK